MSVGAFQKLDLDPKLVDEFYDIGLSTLEELYAFLVTFSGFGENKGIPLNKITSDILKITGMPAGKVITASSAGSRQYAHGAVPPSNANYQNGKSVAKTASRQNILGNKADLRHTLSSPIKDQGDRSTCVAFSLVACLEHKLSEPDLSEQFQYWSAKLQGSDPHPDTPGTRLEYAVNGLSSVGVCEESHWPYSQALIPSNETHQSVWSPIAPSSAATTDATTRKSTGYDFEDLGASSQRALRVYNKLKNGPVAITLPVFEDPNTKQDNWLWNGAIDYGRVLNPWSSAIAYGGHAVCLTEFRADLAAPGGGWFVFKNSWGNSWSTGQVSPPQGQPKVPTGYGYLSAMYVEDYAWEICQIG